MIVVYYEEWFVYDYSFYIYEDKINILAFQKNIFVKRYIWRVQKEKGKVQIEFTLKTFRCPEGKIVNYKPIILKTS